jgi:hypothetical protein
VLRAIALNNRELSNSRANSKKRAIDLKHMEIEWLWNPFWFPILHIVRNDCNPCLNSWYLSKDVRGLFDHAGVRDNATRTHLLRWQVAGNFQANQLFCLERIKTGPIDRPVNHTKQPACIGINVGSFSCAFSCMGQVAQWGRHLRCRKQNLSKKRSM